MCRYPGLSGPELQGRLNELGSTLPIVFLTGHADTPTTVRTIKAGAEDFLTKPVSVGAVARRHRAGAGAAFDRARRNGTGSMTCARCWPTLTPRERQVFGLVVRGKLNKQIAHELGTTERTIKAHRQQVMEKMKVQSLAELVSIAERLGLLALEIKSQVEVCAIFHEPVRRYNMQVRLTDRSLSSLSTGVGRIGPGDSCGTIRARRCLARSVTFAMT